MGMRSESLAKHVEGKVEEGIALVATLSEADWHRVTAAERWTVGVTAHHLATALAPIADMVRAVASGEARRPLSTAVIDEMNAQHAREHAHCTRADTIALLREGAAVAARVVRHLPDADLAKTAIVIAELPAMTVEQLIMAGLLGHIDEHVGSIRATIGAEQEIVITRLVDAHRDVVFKAWTEPERLGRWWGPHGFTTPVCTIDLRPGGVFRTCMRSPDGADYWSTGVYREVVVPERVVVTDSFSDAEGNVVEPTQYGMSPSWPREALITMAFEDADGKTRMTLRHAVGSAADSEREMCRNGWNESLDRLAASLAQA